LEGTQYIMTNPWKKATIVTGNEAQLGRIV